MHGLSSVLVTRLQMDLEVGDLLHRRECQFFLFRSGILTPLGVSIAWSASTVWFSTTSATAQRLLQSRSLLGETAWGELVSSFQTLNFKLSARPLSPTTPLGNRYRPIETMPHVFSLAASYSFVLLYGRSQ